MCVNPNYKGRKNAVDEMFMDGEEYEASGKQGDHRSDPLNATTYKQRSKLLSWDVLYIHLKTGSRWPV
jgi:hypothetical protein